jgi:small subunit ribosomal protein S17
MSERGQRKTVTGVVVSDKMDKSVVVEQEVQVKHPRYGKFIRRKMKHMAHDEENAAKVGDMVELTETRPLSRRKCWRVTRIMQVAGALRGKRARK